MSVAFEIVETISRITGFEQITSQLTLGDLSLRERLIQQCERLNISYGITSKESAQFCLYDNCIYSDTLLLYFKNNAKILNQSKVQIETTWNAAITFKNQKSLHADLFSKNANSITIPQRKLLCVDLNLPETVYPEKDYHVVATDLFYQKIETWNDLLIAQSLVAREFTSQTVGFWKPKLPNFISNWLFNNPRLAAMTNKIGKNCCIHPTAILESCVIGDNVEIGAFCYLRASVIGSNVTIREKSSVKLSVIGAGSYILPTDIFNCYLGNNVTLTTHILFHCVIGDSTFIGGGVGFADLNASKQSIKMQTEKNEPKSDSNHLFLGSCVAENCFIGAGLLFHVGRLVPHNTKLLNFNMIHKDDFLSFKTYVSNQGKITQIPESFLTSEKKI